MDTDGILHRSQEIRVQEITTVMLMTEALEAIRVLLWYGKDKE